MMAETHITPSRLSNKSFVTVHSDSLNVHSKGNLRVLRLPSGGSKALSAISNPKPLKGLDNIFGYNPKGFIKLKKLPLLATLSGFILIIGFISNQQEFIRIMNPKGLWNYHIINYSAEFITFTDIQSLGFLLYLAFPFLTILLGIILWVV
jgi:hypothetical protein